MKIFALLAITFLLNTFFIIFAMSDIIKPSKRVPRFISFDHKGGRIDVDLDLSIPFISIPLSNDENQSGDHPKSLLNINIKSLTFAALLAAMTAFIVPLFTKTPYDQQHYRLDDRFEFQELGQKINELILGNNYVTPCLQQAVCHAVTKINKNKTTTSSEKIIEGISNSSWFQNWTNGTAIEEAIRMAHQTDAQCSRNYNKCGIPADVFQAIMNELGIN